jgi:hypothetical protein
MERMWKNAWKLLSSPPYSLDLAFSDCHLFEFVKGHMQPMMRSRKLYFIVYKLLEQSSIARESANLWKSGKNVLIGVGFCREVNTVHRFD